MSNRTSLVADGRLRIQRELLELLNDLREARLRLGLSQRAVARPLRWSQSRVARLEAGRLQAVTFEEVAAYAALMGLRLSARLYLDGAGLRDNHQLRMINTYRVLVAPGAWGSGMEVPVGGSGDLRAVDYVLFRDEVRIGHEFISRLRDVQAQARRLLLKKRDAGLTRLMLVIADTHANRRAVAEAGDVLRDAFPLSTRSVLHALRRGEDPGADGLVFLRAMPRAEVRRPDT